MPTSPAESIAVHCPRLSPAQDMKRKRALELQRSWGDRPCPHPALAKEYDLGQRTGNFVCTQCGAILSHREKLEWKGSV